MSWTGTYDVNYSLGLFVLTEYVPIESEHPDRRETQVLPQKLQAAATQKGEDSCCATVDKVGYCCRQMNVNL